VEVCLTIFIGHDGEVTSLAFSPDGATLASGSADRTVRLWEVASGQERRTLQGHDGEVTSLAFSPDGATLASGSADNTVRLWEVASGRCFAILAHLGEGWVAFTPEGRYKLRGDLRGGFWHSIALCRFEPGELDPYSPNLRMTDDEPFVAAALSGQ
jgi:WD40 repeat protein